MENMDYYSHGIDYANAISRFLGKEDLYFDFLRKFIANNSFHELKPAIESNDADKVFEIAHSLKGVTGNLSLYRLNQLLIPFTESVRNKDNCLEAKELFPQLEEEYQQTICYLTSIL